MSNGEFVRIGVMHELTDRQTVGIQEFPIGEAQRIVEEQNSAAIAKTFFIVPNQTQLSTTVRSRETPVRTIDEGDSL